MRPRLIIFAKAPLMGKAKTRLAADIGFVHAQRLYRAMTAQIIRNVQDPRWDTILAITPPHWLGRVPQWRGIAQYAQVRGSLTPRLLQAFSRKGPTIVIGTDCPSVTAQHIANGFASLKRSDTVLGPADDGGFWLIGLNGPAPTHLFENVRWSSAHTLSDVAKNISGSIEYLETLIDVDNLEALRAYRRQKSNRT